MSDPTMQPITALPLAKPAPPKRIPAPWVAATQIFWWLVFAAVVGMNLLAISPLYEFLQHACVSDECNDFQLRLFLFRGWLAMGFTAQAYAAIAMAVNFIPTFAYLIVGAILFFAKPIERMVYFTSLVLILFGGVTYSGTVIILTQQNPLWWYPIVVFNFLGGLGILVFFFLFPNGELAPPWSRYWVAFLFLHQVLETINFRPINLRFLPQVYVDVVFVVSVMSVVIAQLWRYRYVSNATERRQTKWVVYGTSLALFTFIGAALTFVAIPGLTENVLAEVGLSLILGVLISIIPISIAIAMLRSRLWDIDLIINRTIVYGSMTAIIAGMLAVLSDAARKFFLALTGETSEIAPMVATLLIVALFEPIRKRVQEFVDRHFKYATGALGAFGDKVSEFVQMNDADALAKRFLKETLASFDVESGAIYLGHDKSLRLVSSAGEWNGRAVLGVPLEHAGRSVGLLALGTRTSGDTFSEQERASLQKTAAVVAHAIVLAEKVDGESFSVHPST